MPQARGATGYPLRTVLAFHWVETLLGALLWAGLATGLVSWWLIPIAASLLLAVPLSLLSAYPLARVDLSGLRLDSPLTLREPAIVTRARHARAHIAAELNAANIPAE